MQNKINKILNLMLLLSTLNGNILSMKRTATFSMSSGIFARQAVKFNNIPLNNIQINNHNPLLKLFSRSLSNNVNSNKSFWLKGLTKFNKPLVTSSVMPDTGFSVYRYYSDNNICNFYLKNIISQKYRDFNINNINRRDAFGCTILIRATQYNDKNTIKLLLQYTAIDINIKNNLGETALMLAAKYDYKDILQLLIDNNASINEKNNGGDTALMLAAMNGHKGIVEVLIDKGANANEKSNLGRTALMFASKYDYKDIVQLLIGNGADVNARDNDGYTALIWATMYGHKSIIEVLIDNGANVDEKNNYGDHCFNIGSNIWV